VVKDVTIITGFFEISVSVQLFIWPSAAPAIIMHFQHSSISLPSQILERNCCVGDARQFLFHRRWQEADHSHQPRYLSCFRVRHHQSWYFTQAVRDWIRQPRNSIELPAVIVDRPFSICKLGRHCSKKVTCSSGVPQRFVLEPLLFISYVLPVGDLIKSHGVSHTLMILNCSSQ